MSGLSEREIAAFQEQAWPLRLPQDFIDLAGQIKDVAVAAAREEAAAKIEPLLSATSGHARGEVSEWGPQVYCRKCGESWPCEVAEARDALAADIRKGADRG